jgi:metallophosphoesterase (TIGR03767 family)
MRVYQRSSADSGFGRLRGGPLGTHRAAMPRPISRRHFLKLSGGAVAAVPLTRIPWASAETLLGSQDLTTLDKTIVKGGQKGSGSVGNYYALTFGPGEPWLQRTELGPPSTALYRSALSFVHFTDVHLVDAQSPARVEFLDRYADQQCGTFPLNAAQRPQETMELQVFESMIRRIRAIRSGPASGKPFRFMVSTGDNVDNRQLNELRWFIDTLDGGQAIVPNSGDLTKYEGVQSTDWSVPGVGSYDPEYWHPDPVTDKYKELWGFPNYPGLLSRAIKPFTAQGIGLPWVQTFGNHDGLVQGNAPANTAFNAIAVGSLKFDTPPPDIDLCDPFSSAGTWVPTHPVAADPNRAFFTRAQYVQEMFDTTSAPTGHGFTSTNLANGTAYYVSDTIPGYRFISLDTVNPGGYDEGSIGQQQLDWMQARLQEVSQDYFDANGNRVHNPNAQNRLVILFSHHGLRSLDNPFPSTDGDNPRYQAEQVEPIVHQYPNVIGWVNGHTHDNVITPRPDPSGRTPGFWDIGTAAHVDWTSQTRIIEPVIRQDGTISIFCTMVDHQAPPDPSAPSTQLMRLASIHRELTANDPQYGFDSKGPGTPEDRNVELLLPGPAWL